MNAPEPLCDLEMIKANYQHLVSHKDRNLIACCFRVWRRRRRTADRWLEMFPSKLRQFDVLAFPEPDRQAEYAAVSVVLLAWIGNEWPSKYVPRTIIGIRSCAISLQNTPHYAP